MKYFLFCALVAAAIADYVEPSAGKQEEIFVPMEIPVPVPVPAPVPEPMPVPVPVPEPASPIADYSAVQYGAPLTPNVVSVPVNLPAHHNRPAFANVRAGRHHGSFYDPTINWESDSSSSSDSDDSDERRHRRHRKHYRKHHHHSHGDPSYYPSSYGYPQYSNQVSNSYNY